MMDWEGKVESPKLVCGVSGRPIVGGETFYSGLVFADGRFQRRDIAADAWQTLDKAPFLSWWKGRAPTADKPGLRIDAEALLQIFRSLKDSTERPKQCFLFVVVLFLARARKLRFRGTSEGNGSTWLLVEERDGQVWRVRDPAMLPEEEQAVQANLAEIVTLGGDVAEQEDGAARR